MNQVILVGRLAQDVELRYIAGTGTPVATFTVAVERELQVKMVFEQRAVIKEVNPTFQWGAFIANQPEHILRVLGLDMLM